MKTYEQLSEAEKAKALEKCVTDLLCAIVAGEMRFNDKLNNDDLQKRIDAAFKKADKLSTPWFAAEIIMETCRDDIEGMARCDCEDALYLEPGEKAIRL